MTELTNESELRAGLRALEREADLPPEVIDRALAAAQAHRSDARSSVTLDALPTAATGIAPAKDAGASRPARIRPRAAPALAALMVVAVVVVILLVIRTGRHPTQPAGSPAPLTVRIELDRTSVPAGTPITGTAIVTNNTGHPLLISDCHGVWLQVGLASGAIPFVPGWLDCLSVPGTKMPVGTMTMPITVATTYNACTSRAGSATADDPACIHGKHGAAGMPPLPPGTYSTQAAILLPDGVPVSTPNTVDVTLTP